MDDVGAGPLEGVPAEQLEALRVALAAMLGRGEAVTLRRLRAAAKARAEFARLVLAAWRAGKLLVTPVAPAEGVVVEDEELTPESLAELVQDVDSHEAHLKATSHVTRAIALGKVSPQVGKALLDCLKESRQGIKGAAAEGGDTVERLEPCTEEGGRLISVFEAIGDDKRRERVLRHARKVLAQDLEKGPSGRGIAAPSERGAGVEPVDGEAS